MELGTIDLLVLLFIFLGLQAWWIIPIIKNNNMLNKKNSALRKEINQLERIFKK